MSLKYFKNEQASKNERTKYLLIQPKISDMEFVMRTFLITTCLLLNSLSLANSHNNIGKIKNQDLDLTYIDHVLTGRIGDRPVLARPLEKEFGVYMWHRANGQNFETRFKSSNSTLKGDIISVNNKGKSIKKEFTITSTSRETGSITGKVGEKTFLVEVTSETMNGHHYVNPQFLITIDNKEEYEFNLESSQACMGCIIKISYSIISMLYSYGAI